MKSNKKKLSFLISGRGSNLLEILVRNTKLNYFETYSIVSNNLISKEIKKFIKNNNLNIKLYENKSKLRLSYFKNINLIFSVGYMKFINTKLINNIKIINLHPSLLPKYKGLLTHKRMLINNEKLYGFTIHEVSENLDGGKIISQKSNKIKLSDEIYLSSLHKNLEHNFVYKELIKYLN